MKAHPVLNRTFILRCQPEYSAAAQAVILRCMLAMPVTGQQCGFTELDTLLLALPTELTTMQTQLTPPDQ
jgi:hypothetical protein